jgi:type I restriction enzyme S subunit
MKEDLSKYEKLNSNITRRRLDSFSTFSMGFTPDTLNKDFWEGDNEWLSIAGISKQGKYITGGNKRISDSAINEKRSPFEVGTLIMSFKLSIGKMGILTKKVFTNEAICGFLWNEDVEVSTEYMYYALSSVNITSFGSRAVKGVTLNSENIGSIVVPMRPFPEQEKIASFFSALDENIDAHVLKLGLLKQQKQGYMQQVFNRTLRFRDDDGREYGEWEETTLGEVAKWSSGGTPTSTTTKYYTNGIISWCVIGDLTERVVVKTKQSITEEAIKNSSAKVFPVNTVMFAMYGASIGRSGVMGKAMATNQAIACGSAIEAQAIPSFLLLIMQKNKEKFISYGQGGAQPNISKGQIESFSVSLPSLPEQEKIAEFFSALDDNIDAVARKIELLKEQKQGYMQRMFG